MRGGAEAPVEPAEKAAFFHVMAFGHGLEQRATQRRRKRQGQKGREGDGQRHGQRELPVDVRSFCFL